MPSVKGDDGTPSGYVPQAPFGVWGDSGSPGPFGGGGNGVIGSSGLSSGVAGFTLANSKRAAGIFGRGPAVGVAGYMNGATTAPTVGVGVYGSGSNDANLGGVGIQGISDTSVGVSGESKSGIGMLGQSSVGGYNFGVVGKGPNAGVAAFNPNNENAAYLASDCCAAWFTGGVVITGPLTKGGGGFKIDHPLDPGEKYLSHSFVESAEMKNMYDGFVLTDRTGEAVIELPNWFAALNSDFRYQLTSVGAAAPSLHIAEEISNHRFRIAGARPNTKVCWQVTGIRQDAWAKAHPMHVEEPKKAKERGHYLHPKLHGAAEEESIGRLRHPHMQ